MSCIIIVNTWNGIGDTLVYSYPRQDINPLYRTIRDSSLGVVNVLSRFVAKWNAKFRKELHSMPMDVSPHYRSLLTDYGAESSRCLEQSGFEDLIQPMQQLHMGDAELVDDSPLADFSKLVSNRRAR
ncbi:hypothetical protein vseg_001577 [Gypsophila vaccaria]